MVVCVDEKPHIQALQRARVFATAGWPRRERLRPLHVILDNLDTHKLKRDRWLQRHSQVHLHFTPTYRSWLNQVECWFGILSCSALRGASFTSARQLREAIDKFVTPYSADAAPFEWTKAVVHPTASKHRYADLCK